MPSPSSSVVGGNTEGEGKDVLVVVGSFLVWSIDVNIVVELHKLETSDLSNERVVVLHLPHLLLSGAVLHCGCRTVLLLLPL